MASICSSCNEPITDGNILMAFDMAWHPQHLACKVCGKDFADGSPVKEGEDGFAYCEADYDLTFRPKCPACGNPVEPTQPKIEALDKIWHTEHFKCPLCTEPLKGLEFFPGDDGMPYCERHYYEKLGLFCVVCERPIISGKRIRMGDQSYHTEHFCCSFCKKHLIGLTYKEKNKKPYCVRCHTQLFG